MEPHADRELTHLERAIQRFNAGEDPSAQSLQRALLAAPDVMVPLAAEPDRDHPETWRMVATESGGVEFLIAFSHADRIPRDFAERHPFIVGTTGERVVRMTAGAGLTINPGSPAELAVAVMPGGVHEMLVLADAQSRADAALAAREPLPLEVVIGEIDLEHVTNVDLARLGEALWGSTLFIPTSRPIEGRLDPAACVTYGEAPSALIGVFTDRDQVGDLAAAHLTELSGRDLYFRLPPGVGLFFNPTRSRRLGLVREGVDLAAIAVEHRIADEVLSHREPTPVEAAILATKAESAGDAEGMALMTKLWTSDLYVIGAVPFPDDFRDARPWSIPRDAGPHVVAFTSRDLVGEFEIRCPYVTRVAATDLIARCTDGTGIVLNYGRSTGIELGAAMLERARRLLMSTAGPAGTPDDAPAESAPAPKRRGLFGRRG
jgi:hypothetical protein